jgi:tyrosyl-tRNA synthetase
MGGGTSKVGDPSGKDEQRKLLTTDDIAANIAGIKGVFEKFLTFGEGPTDAVIVNNADWLNQLQYIDFLRDYGRHFSVNRMLTFDSVKLRLEREQPLSFLEFNYMVLQSYDFLELSRRHNCRLQLGGSDQWGNIVSGVELGRRVDGTQLFGLTSPLLTTASGAKMGKTASGAVWLNNDKLSAYDYWQYWRNTADADVGRFLRLFTELPLDEIAKLESRDGANINDAKIILANAATVMCHGPDAANAAAETARQTFVEGGAGEDLPRIDITSGRLNDGVPFYELLKESGLAKSNGEARRLIKGGGGRLNDTVVSEEQASVTLSNVNEDGVIKLSAGRKRHALVIPT